MRRLQLPESTSKLPRPSRISPHHIFNRFMFPLFSRSRALSLVAAVSLGGTIASAAEPQVFTIKTLPAQMRYDTAELTVTPGADVKIIFENTDDMPHNMVFFQPGTDVV